VLQQTAPGEVESRSYHTEGVDRPGDQHAFDMLHVHKAVADEPSFVHS
jgi:hypothetical protein